MSRIAGVVRTARKAYPCDGSSYERHQIKPGDRYRREAVPPGGEMGYTTWITFRECAKCCEAWGRPIPEVTAA